MATDAQPLLLKDFRPAPLPGVSKNAILSFDRYKAGYILVLVGFHQHLLTNPRHSIQISAHLPYQTVDHGVELMMGMLLITGWLSSATWKENTWKGHMKKKVSRLMPPYIMTLVLTAIPVAASCRSWTCWFQFSLECTTFSGWNPALIWWTYNRPLWFMSTVLTYHYASPFYLRWIRKRSVRELMLSLLGLYFLRTGLAAAVLFVLQALFGSLEDVGRAIHCFSPLQVWVPAMGAILEQLAQRVTVPLWVTKMHLWIATDMLIVMIVLLTVPVPSTQSEVLNRLIEYSNLLTGLALMLLVTLMSCDCNSLRFCTSATQGLREFFAGLLNVSYTMFLTHWPLDMLFQMAGLFRADSWDSVIGSWSVQVCIAIFLDNVVMDSFTRLFMRWLQGSEQAERPERHGEGRGGTLRATSSGHHVTESAPLEPHPKPKGDTTSGNEPTHAANDHGEAA